MRILTSVLLSILFIAVSVPARASLHVAHEDFELSSSQPSSSMTLRPTSTHVCFLSGFMGNSGGGRVYAQTKPSKWVLQAFHGFTGTRVRARCVQAGYGRITRNPQDLEMLNPIVSPNFTAAVTDARCQSVTTRMWETDTVSILQGFDGRLDETTHSSSVFTPTIFLGGGLGSASLRAGSCNHTAYGSSIDLFASGTATLSEEYEITAAPPNDYTTPARVPMTNASSSFCYFTKVNGDFREFSQIDIVKLDNRWQLQAKTEAAPYNGTISAKARCVIGLERSK
jgi:hypothetical protein